MENNMNQNMFMDWNDTIAVDGQEYIVLPEGDYDFKVTGFERSRFPGSTKIPACNMASLTLTVDTPDGTVSVKTDLILYRTVEWRISSFFRSVGLKRNGENMVMDWNHVIGTTGRAHFKPRNYMDKNGNERQANNVDRFLEPGDKDPAWVKEAQRQPERQMPAQQNGSFRGGQQGSWRGGQF